MRTVGLLGGMTFEATAIYYNVINRHVRSKLGGRRSAPLFLYSADQEVMLQHATKGDWTAFAKVFISAGNALKGGGAEGLAICASLAHKVADEVESQVGLPVLHVADFTAKGILAKGLKRVALLGTAVVMEGEFMKGRIEQKFGIDVLVPGSEERARINQGIVSELTTGKVSPETKAFFIQTIKDLCDRGAQGLILGSTDLGFLIKQEDVDIPLFDTALLHAQGVAEWVVGTDKP
ncbi:hypothetical protein H2200_013038 [Cladophialophora chaetospira]|uniref:Aspartate racemase n=1 Tax=Cladophialophora chaetospira TaxID=386627 RepID=A0AA39CBS5_9EURO|nr:hypothetical protein H2200_013038 [Cladophialophora chaetospira]